jgi:hypothetical protein
MARERKQKKRTVRYTILLSPVEYDLAKKAAEREFRTLPDFLRAVIYHRAAELHLIANPLAASSYSDQQS